MLKKWMPRRGWIVLVAFCLPVALYLMVMVVLRIVPFGDKTLLLWDADGQYASFLAALRGTLLGENDALYSLSMLMGNGTTGLFAYYLASPLNWLAACFSVENLPLAFSFIVLLKLGLCGLSFSYYLQKTYDIQWKGLLFSTSYALMGYTAIYFWDIMWLDAIVLLPLIVMGLNHLLNGGKPFLYTLSLGLALFCNYYIGWMLCLFSALYYLSGAVFRRVQNKQWALWKTTGRFALASLLAGGLAAVLLLPTAFMLQKGDPIWWSTALTVSRENGALDLLTKLYTGAVDFQQVRYGLPNIFIGIPMLALACVYFLHPAVPTMRKLRTALMLGVFVLGFCVHILYMLWHAFDSPNCMPARFSFLFCFVLIDAAAQGFQALITSKERLSGMRCGVLAGGFVFVTAVLFRDELPTYLTYETVVFDVIVFICTVGLLALMDRSALRRAGMLMLCGMQFSGLLLNAYFCIRRLDYVDTMRVSQYQETVGEVSPLVERIKAGDDGLYRMEKNFSRSENDALLFDYAGLSHYSSAADRRVNHFMQYAGFYHAYLGATYENGATPVLDGLFGMRYLLWKENGSLADAPVGFVPLWQSGDVTAYKNTTALPLAYMVAPGMDAPLSDPDVFANQNLILSDLLGTPIEVFTKDEAFAYNMQGDEMHITLPVAANEQLYMKITGGYFFWNDEGMENRYRFSGCVALPLSQTDAVYRLVALQTESAEPYCTVYRYHEDVWRQAYETLKAGACEVQSDTDSRLTVYADVARDGQRMLLTLPYDEGWQVTVDGQPAKAEFRFDALMALTLTQGEHVIELRYIPNGLIPGAIISAVSLLTLIGWAVMAKRSQPRERTLKPQSTDA